MSLKDKVSVIFNTDGTPCIENGKILVQDNCGTYSWQKNSIKDVYLLLPADNELYYIASDATVVEDLELECHFPRESNIIKKWSPEATSLLITSFQAHEKLFNNNTVKHDVVWAKIEKELNEGGHKFSKSQIKDRWKYLKMKYFKKKITFEQQEMLLKLVPFL